MGAATVATLNTKINADPRGLISGFSQAQKSIGAFQGVFSSMQAKMAAIGGGAGVAGLIGWGVKLASDVEKAKITLGGLIESEKKAGEIIKAIREKSNATPMLGVNTMLQSVTTLAQFGTEASKLLPTMTAIGQVTLGDAEKMSHLSLAVAQMVASGRLMGQDANQMAQSGFAPLALIAAKTGESILQVKARMEAAQVSSAEVLDVLAARGAKLQPVFDKISSESFTGKVAAMQKAAEKFAMTLGVAAIPAITKLIEITQPLAATLAVVDPRLLAIAGGAAAFAGGTWMVIRAVQIAIPVFRGLVTAFRALATAQAIQQAFAGPAGWLALAGAAVVAGVAVAGIAASFDGVDKQAKKAADAAKEVDKVATSAVVAKAAIDAVAISTKDWAKALEKVGDITGFDEMQKRLEKMNEDGAEITKKVRTPEQKFTDEITHLEKLRQAGSITGDVMAKAFADASKELDEAILSTLKLKEATSGVGAVTQNSTAGFSAVFGGIREAAERARQAAELTKRRDAIDVQGAIARAAEPDFRPTRPTKQFRENTGFSDSRTPFSVKTEQQLQQIIQHEKDVAESKKAVAERDKKIEEDAKARLEQLKAIRENTKNKIVVKVVSL